MKSLFDQALDAEGVTGKAAELARSIYKQESGGGRNTRTSNAGAVGGMQILPGTFKSVADKAWDIANPLDNARAGIRYVNKMLDKAGGDVALAAAGYYGGPGAINKAKKGIAVSDPRNPNAPNTLQYGKQVAARMGGSSTDDDDDALLARLNRNASKTTTKKTTTPIDDDDALLARLNSKSSVKPARDAGGRSQVATLAAQGKSAYEQTEALRKAGYGKEIDDARMSRVSDEDIVARLAPTESAAGRAAAKKVEDKGILGRLDAGMFKARDDIGMGIRQIWNDVTGDDAELAQLREVERQRRGNLENIALGESTAASIGSGVTKALPAIAGVAAAPFTGGSSLGVTGIALGAAGGALGGALEPTVEDGERGRNATVGAVTGAAGPALGAVARVGGAAAGRGTQAVMRGGETPLEYQYRIMQMQAQGGIPSAANISSRAAKVANTTGDRVIGSRALGGDKRLAESVAQRKMAQDMTGVSDLPAGRGGIVGDTLKSIIAVKSAGTTTAAGQGINRLLTNPKYTNSILGLNPVTGPGNHQVLGSALALPSGSRGDVVPDQAAVIQSILDYSQETGIPPDELLKKMTSNR